MAQPARDAKPVSGAFRVTWWARYIGLPFERLGRGPEAYDCWGLVRAVYADRLGLALPEHGGIAPEDVGRIGPLMARPPEVWRIVAAPRALDVMVASARPGSRVPCHVGVMVDARRVLHVARGTNAAVMPVDHPFLQGRILCFRRHEACP